MVKNMAKTKPSKRSVEYTQSTHILYIHICLHNMFICLLLPWFDITLIAWCYLCLKQLQSMYVSMAIKWTPNCLHMDVTGNSGHATRAGAAVVKHQFGNQALSNFQVKSSLWVQAVCPPMCPTRPKIEPTWLNVLPNMHSTKAQNRKYGLIYWNSIANIPVRAVVVPKRWEYVCL